jgi:Outer membrane protein beta-barrel domain
MKRSAWAGVVSGLATLAVALPSFAEPATSGSLQLGLGFRQGIELNDGDLNPWGTGLGINGGYTLPAIPIYVGGTFEYFFGNTVESPGYEQKARLWQIMAEGGYDIGLSDLFVLRPKLGLGPATVTGRACFLGQCASDTETKIAVAPGLTLMLFTPVIRLSFDARYELVLTDNTPKAFIFSAGIGF